MRVYCESIAVFNGDGRLGLQRLLMRVRLGQHQLILRDLEAFLETKFFANSVSADDKQEVQELLQRQYPELSDRGLDPAVRQGPRADLVEAAAEPYRVDNGWPVWQIDPHTAGEWAEAPLRVLVENENDWHLVAAAARVYGRTRIQNAKDLCFLKLDQRGGVGEVQNAVEVAATHQRVAVFVDSDRVHWQGPEGPSQRKIRELASAKNNILLLVLQKREVENYLPIPVLSAAVDERQVSYNSKKYNKRSGLRKRLRTWSRLAEHEKDFIDLQTLFPFVKDLVPKFADTALVPDSATLESRAGRTELPDLLSQLEAWL